MKRIPILLVLALLLVVCLAAGSTDSRFTDSARIPDNTFTAADYFPRPLSDLAIGDKVMDSTWEWSYRGGADYSGAEDLKPVIWIVVGKNHFEEETVLLLAEEVIAKRPFDTRGNFGSNSWWDSTRIRKWLGDEVESVFYRNFSPNFKQAIVQTRVPNKYYNSGSVYITIDRVFVLSETELGITSGLEIGETVEYFYDAPSDTRKAQLGGNPVDYWTRSPSTESANRVRYIQADGNVSEQNANNNTCGYRPALNLDGNTPVRFEPAGKIYVIHWS